MRRRRKLIVPLAMMFLFVFTIGTAQPVAAWGGAHSSMTYDAINILYAELANVTEISQNGYDISRGNTWADNSDENPDRNLHYHDAITHCGLLVFGKSAAVIANEGMAKAIQCYADGDIDKAFFWLGFALHHVQDVFIPAHTDVVDCGFAYHIAYEDYCDDHYTELSDVAISPTYTFEPNTVLGVTHHDPSTAFGWVDYGAHISQPFQSECLMIAGNPGLMSYGQVAEILVPACISVTAGFILWAYHQMNPSADVDGDGLSYEEELAEGTTPWDSDSDNDKMPDGYEIDHGFDPTFYYDGGYDSDADGLSNAKEYLIGTKPLVRDTDGDSMRDGWEYKYGLNPLSSSDKYLDKDGDGLKNYVEHSKGTNPTKSDSDGDGLSDYSEIYTYRTNPTRFDTDGDGYGDGWEIANGYDPLSYASRPLPPSDPIFMP